MTNHTSKKSSGDDLVAFLQRAGLVSGQHAEAAEISVEEQANQALANLERSGQTELAARLRAEWNGEAPSPEAQPADSETHDDDVIGFLQKAGLVSKSAS